jgi:hypothetical protein
MSLKSLIAFDEEHWLFIRNCIPNADNVFELLMEQVKDKVKGYMIGSYYSEDKLFPSRRLSCIFKTLIGENISKSNYRSDLTVYDWSESSVIFHMKIYLEKLLNTKFTKALVHLYRDGNDKIDPHSDREATNSIVASISLGAKRLFRFREKYNKQGEKFSYELESGSMILMKRTCQRFFVHSVPVQKRVLEPRINITFRQS